MGYKDVSFVFSRVHIIKIVNLSFDYTFLMATIVHITRAYLDEIVAKIIWEIFWTSDLDNFFLSESLAYILRKSWIFDSGIGIEIVYLVQNYQKVGFYACLNFCLQRTLWTPTLSV